MYVPNYISALFTLDSADDGFAVGYSEYLRMVFRRRHYGHTKKYRK